MFPPRPTHLLHRLIQDIIKLGDTVIDATAGNGHDTVFLAKAVGPQGRVLAFDIQEKAITSTTSRLTEENLLERVRLHRESHDKMDDFAERESVSVIVFNLGYLPGADHEVITTTPSTIKAMSVSAALLKQGGVLAVICYPGHSGGDEEAEAVEKHLALEERFRTAKYQLLSTKQASPFLLIALKIRSD